MVKINYEFRIKQLETIIKNSKRINKQVPKLEKELKRIKTRQQKGNKNLFDFKLV